jgi:hypothetical protein
MPRKPITLERTTDGYRFDTRQVWHLIRRGDDDRGVIYIRKTRMGDDKQWWSVHAGDCELLCRSLADVRIFLAEIDPRG